ncbi:MAG TPA: amidohydrolase [Paludibaculum sp.]|jgi:aminobenzoyl-glutamate utilization protein B
MTQGTTMLGLAFFVTCAAAQTPGAQAVLRGVEALSPRFDKISRQIWENPELGWREYKSSALLKEELRAAGFRITDNVASLPTAFTAEWGAGAPVIGIIGEYDALPGLSQIDLPEKQARVAGAPGHGCGHNLFGPASAMAAIAAKEQLVARKLPGTIRFYGTPYEEGGAGKVYMIRAGAFKDTSAVLAWHPWDGNMADDNSWLANVRADVRFKGSAAHAAGAPDAGRSALDAVELMTHAVNMMREHVPQETRMHYIITNGGAAANIVPDAAALSIIVRHPDLKTLEGLWERVMNCAQAGALATGTTVEIEIAAGYANFVTNSVLRDLLDRNLKITGGVNYTPEESAFAERVRSSVGAGTLPPLDAGSKVQAPRTTLSSVSTDVGDVSWVTPTGHMLAATFPPGVPLHSWQSTACAGTTIGRKGMMVAAKTLALSAVELFQNPELVKQARATFDTKMAGQKYRSLIPEGKRPALPAAQ